MSLTATYATEIVVPKPQLTEHAGNIKGTPCFDILRRAVERVAAERAGRVAEAYQDCNGKAHPCLIGLSAPGFPRGVGVQIDSGGRVVFAYDRQGADAAAAEAIAGDVARAYAVIAVLRVQQQHGYAVEVVSDTPRPGGGRRVKTMAVRV